MAGLAEGLPVVHIPEQGLVAPVWLDMVHYGSRLYLTNSLTAYTQRPHLQE